MAAPIVTLERIEEALSRLLGVGSTIPLWGVVTETAPGGYFRLGAPEGGVVLPTLRCLALSEPHPREGELVAGQGILRFREGRLEFHFADPLEPLEAVTEGTVRTPPKGSLPVQRVVEGLRRALERQREAFTVRVEGRVEQALPSGDGVLLILRGRKTALPAFVPRGALGEEEGARHLTSGAAIRGRAYPEYVFSEGEIQLVFELVEEVVPPTRAEERTGARGPIQDLAEFGREVEAVVRRQWPEELWIEGRVVEEVGGLVTTTLSFWLEGVGETEGRLLAQVPHVRVEGTVKPEVGARVRGPALLGFDPVKGEMRLTFRSLKVLAAPPGTPAYRALLEALREAGVLPARRREVPQGVLDLGLLVPYKSPARAEVVSRFRRAPRIQLQEAPTGGPGATEALLSAFEELLRKRPEVILIVRDGQDPGGLEVFSSFALARAIAESPIPVVTALSRGRSWSLADLAADLVFDRPIQAVDYLQGDAVPPSKPPSIDRLLREGGAGERLKRWLKK